MENKIKIILLENNERSLSFLIEALNIYSDEIPHNVRTSTNEIVYWFDKYNKMSEDRLMIFALVFENQIVGFMQAVYFKTVRFATIDYVAIKKDFRKYFASFFTLLIESISKNSEGINFLVTEIDGENKPLERLAKIKGFESIGDYIQPPVSGMEDTEIMAKLLLKRIGSNESYIEPNIVVKTLYFNHYLRWYKPLLTQKEYSAYEAKIVTLYNAKIKEETLERDYIKTYLNAETIYSSGSIGDDFKKMIENIKTVKDMDEIMSSLSKRFGINPLPMGMCLLDFKKGHCSNTGSEGCYYIGCRDFVTNTSFLSNFRQQKELIDKEIERLKDNKFAVMNFQVNIKKREKLERIIASLETKGTYTEGEPDGKQ